MTQPVLTNSRVMKMPLKNKMARQTDGEISYSGQNEPFWIVNYSFVSVMLRDTYT